MSIPISFSRRAGKTEAPISYLIELAKTNPGIISLAAGLVDYATLPVAEVQSCLARVFSNEQSGRDSLQYGTTRGDPQLRDWLAQYLKQRDGASAAGPRLSADDIVVATGSQQLLYLLGEVLLDPGDIVLLGVPAYFVYMGVLESLNARMAPVATDDSGLIIDDLNEQLRRIEQQGELARVKLIYDVSYFNNPTGICLAAERKPQLVETARRWLNSHQIFILEDAAYRELRYRGADAPSLLPLDPQRETVIQLGTFSKVFSPGLKTGYMVAPPALVAAVAQQKGHHDFGSANFSQRLLAEAATGGELQRHFDVLRNAYRMKLDTMLRELEIHLGQCADQVTWTKPEGGLYVWLQLPDKISTGREGAFFRRCLDAGVFYVPGEYCFPASLSNAPKSTLRLSFGVQSADGIRDGIRRFAKVLHEFLSGD